MKVTFKKGSQAKYKNTTLDIIMKISGLENNKTYKHSWNIEPNAITYAINKEEKKYSIGE